MKETFGSGDMACQLTGKALIERKLQLRETIFSKVKSFEALPESLVFQFEDKEGILEALFNCVLAETSCCPFFQHQIAIQPNKEGVSWEIGKSENIKAMLLELIKEYGLE